MTVRATNRGERTEYVERIGLRQLDDAGAFEDDEPDDKALHPSKSVTRTRRVEHLGFDLSEGFVGYVLLGNGKVVHSVPQFLDRNLLAMRDAPQPSS